MPPRGYKKPKGHTAADYAAALNIIDGLDRIAEPLSQQFSDCPRVLLIRTVLADAASELSEKKGSLESQKEGTA